MNTYTVTLEDIQQIANTEGTSVLSVITLLQAGAAKVGDSSTLEQLCDIKSAWLDLND